MKFTRIDRWRPEERKGIVRMGEKGKGIEEVQIGSYKIVTGT